MLSEWIAILVGIAFAVALSVYARYRRTDATAPRASAGQEYTLPAQTGVALDGGVIRKVGIYPSERNYWTRRIVTAVDARLIEAIPGVQRTHRDRYRIRVIRAESFRWDEVEPMVVGVLVDD